MKGSSKKAKGLMDTDNRVVIVEGWGWVEVEEGIRGINGNGKNTKKKKGLNCYWPIIYFMFLTEQ